ncbi:MAG: hypothetical protein PUC47_05870 [Oscillospiraceae bacterium]|nr:hypothetical protein [Oscillospiraceae bacterium]
MRGGREKQALLALCDSRLDLYERIWQREGDRDRETLSLTAENLPCAVCRLERQAPDRGDAALLRFTVRILTLPDAPLREGMKLRVRRDREVQWYITCGMPVRYPSHLEVEAALFDWA